MKYGRINWRVPIHLLRMGDECLSRITQAAVRRVLYRMSQEVMSNHT